MDCVLCVFGVYRSLAVGFLIVRVHQVGFDFNFKDLMFDNVPELKFVKQCLRLHIVEWYGDFSYFNV